VKKKYESQHYIQVFFNERSIFWEVKCIGHLSKKVYMYMCPIPNGFEIELFHCTDEQHPMSSHELQSALMLTAEFSKYTTLFTACVRFISMLFCNLSLEFPRLFSNFCSLLSLRPKHSPQNRVLRYHPVYILPLISKTVL
jgi:hypothetical protein